MTIAQNTALPQVHHLFDAINGGDLEVIPQIVTADFVDHGSPVPLPPGPSGYAQILGFVTRVLAVRYEIADLFVTIRLIVQPDRGVVTDHALSPGNHDDQTVHGERNTTTVVAR